MRIEAGLGDAEYGLGTTLSQSSRACCQYAITHGSKTCPAGAAVPRRLLIRYRIAGPVRVNPHIPDMIRAA